MPSYSNPMYFQAILNLFQGQNSTIATIWGIFWQCFYALIGCIVGAIMLGNYGALIGLVIGAWLGFRSINPYRSLIHQMNELNENQKHHLADEVRRTIGSSSIDSLLRYAMNSNGRQSILDMIQRYLNNHIQQSHVNSAFFSRIFS